MTAGYSGTPLLKKLGIKSDFQMVAVDAPDHYRQLLGELPEGAQFLSPANNDLDFVHLFCKEEVQLSQLLVQFKPRIKSKGMIWVSWPKGKSSISTDLNGNVVRATGLGVGLVDIKVCAVDEDWSGLKFVYRIKDR